MSGCSERSYARMKSLRMASFISGLVRLERRRSQLGSCPQPFNFTSDTPEVHSEWRL